MKTCPSRLQLESAVLGEVHPSRVAEFDAHAESCARCRHELNWLRTETTLFAQRTAREEVSRLWESVDARSQSKRGARLTRAMFAIAATVLLAVVGARFMSSAGRSVPRAHLEPVPMSLETMSVDPAADEVASMPCYTPGFGIACGEVQYASR